MSYPTSELGSLTSGYYETSDLVYLTLRFQEPNLEQAVQADIPRTRDCKAAIKPLLDSEEGQFLDRKMLVNSASD